MPRKGKKIREPQCPLISGLCDEDGCAWWIEGQVVDKDGTRGPGQCVVFRIMDNLVWLRQRGR